MRHSEVYANRPTQGWTASGMRNIRRGSRERSPQPVEEQQKTLDSKLRGHYQYYGRPTNSLCLRKFYRGTCRLWHY
jgi:hypothetical protein